MLHVLGRYWINHIQKYHQIRSGWPSWGRSHRLVDPASIVLDRLLVALPRLARKCLPRRVIRVFAVMLAHRGQVSCVLGLFPEKVVQKKAYGHCPKCGIRFVALTAFQPVPVSKVSAPSTPVTQAAARPDKSGMRRFQGSSASTSSTVLAAGKSRSTWRSQV